MAGFAKKRKGNAEDGKVKKVSPYFNFCKLNREKVKQSHPNTPVTKALSQLWKSLTDAQKAEYNQTHPHPKPSEEDRQPHQQQEQESPSIRADSPQNSETQKENEEEEAEEGNENSNANVSPFPLARLKRIIKLDRDVRQVSGEAVWVIASAVQSFLEILTESAWGVAVEKKHKSIRLDDIASAVSRQRRMTDFLEDSLSTIGKGGGSSDSEDEEEHHTKPPQKRQKLPPPPPGTRSIKDFFASKPQAC